jgi:hypothetical protein
MPSPMKKAKSQKIRRGVPGGQCCRTTRASSSRRAGPVRSRLNRVAAHRLEARKAGRHLLCSQHPVARLRASSTKLQILTLPNAEAGFTRTGGRSAQRWDSAPSSGSLDIVRSRYRLGLGASVAVELGPDAGEGCGRPIVIEREPNHILFLGLKVRLGRVFCETVDRHNAAVFGLQPGPPVRRRGVADIDHRLSAGAWGEAHAPAHHDQFTVSADVAHDRGRVVWKHAWHWRQVADVAVRLFNDFTASNLCVSPATQSICRGCRRRASP